jgi:hypothetical protein
MQDIGIIAQDLEYVQVLEEKNVAIINEQMVHINRLTELLKEPTGNSSRQK